MSSQSSKKKNKKLLEHLDSDSEYEPDKEEEEEDEESETRSERKTTRAKTSTTKKKEEGKKKTYGKLSKYVKQQLVIELEKLGGVDNLSPDSQILADVCNANAQLFGHYVGTTPRGRRKKAKNFIDYIKRNYSPTELRKYIVDLIQTQIEPDEEDRIDIQSPVRSDRVKMPSAAVPIDRPKTSIAAVPIVSRPPFLTLQNNMTTPGPKKEGAQNWSK